LVKLNKHILRRYRSIRFQSAVPLQPYLSGRLLVVVLLSFLPSFLIVISFLSLTHAIEPFPHPSSTMNNLFHSPSDFLTYTTTWRELSGASRTRKIACIIAFLFHIPLNVLSVSRLGISFFFPLSVLVSLVNLLCVGLALWKIDVMRGERVVFGRTFERIHFDFALIILICVYGMAPLLLSLSAVGGGSAIYHVLRLIFLTWPLTTATDIFAFVVGWIASWNQEGAVSLA